MTPAEEQELLKTLTEEIPIPEFFQEIADAIKEKIIRHDGNHFQIRTRETHSIIWSPILFRGMEGRVEVWWHGDGDPEGHLDPEYVIGRIHEERGGLHALADAIKDRLGGEEE